MAQQTGVHIVAGKGALKPHWVVCLGWVMITSDSKVRLPSTLPSPLKPTTAPAPLTAPQVLDRLPQFMSTLMATRDDQRAYVEKALLLLLLLLLLLITATYH